MRSSDESVRLFECDGVPDPSVRTTSGTRDDASELERRGHALVAEGHQLLARAAELRARAPSEEWVPVASSPIGKRRTLDLAREGTIESAKVGRLVVIRASSLNAYIDQHRRRFEDEEDLFGVGALVPQLRAPGRRR